MQVNRLVIRSIGVRPVQEMVAQDLDLVPTACTGRLITACNSFSGIHVLSCTYVVAMHTHRHTQLLKKQKIL